MVFNKGPYTVLPDNSITRLVVVSVLNDVIRAADEGKVTCLVLLDLSAAFDTVVLDILLDVLRRRFLVEEPALKWSHSYLNDQTQVITVVGKESAFMPVAYTVPQGSVLGPVHRILKMSPSFSMHIVSNIAYSLTTSNCLYLLQSRKCTKRRRRCSGALRLSRKDGSHLARHSPSSSAARRR